MHGTIPAPRLVTLEHCTGCHWPVKRGNSGKQPWLFCNAGRELGKQYCPTHYAKSKRLPRTASVPQDQILAYELRFGIDDDPAELPAA
jgi:hypothetical protein